MDQEKLLLCGLLVMFAIMCCRLANGEEEMLMGGEVNIENRAAKSRVRRDYYYPYNGWSDASSEEDGYGYGGSTPTFSYSALRICNYYRSIQYAANMLQMLWSPYLASAAQYYANRCTWRESYPYSAYPLPSGTTVSTYMFATTSSQINITSAITLTYNRVCSNYNISGPCYPGQVCGTCTSGQNCSLCTMLLWASSSVIGCAVSQCSPLTGSSYSSGSLLVCYISPGANQIGYYPYVRGPPCSMCPYSYYCQTNLCCQRSANTTTTAAATTQKATTTAAATTTAGATTTASATTTAATTTAAVTTTAATTTAAVTTTADQSTTTAQLTTNTATTSQATSGTTASVTTGTVGTTGTVVTTSQATTVQTTTAQPTTVPPTTAQTTTAQPTTTAQTTTAQPTTTGLTTGTVATTGTVTTGMTTTGALTTAAPSSCDNSTCPTGCQLTGQVCCSCTTYTYYRDCNCCPMGYLCCPPSMYYPRGAGCCPSWATCVGDGSCSYTMGTTKYYFPARSVSYTQTQTCQQNPMLLITADNFFTQLYFNGNQVPPTMYPNSYYPDRLDIIPFPSGTTLVAVKAYRIYGTGGLFVVTTNNVITGTSPWKCMDYSYSFPPSDWYTLTFDDSTWYNAYYYDRYGVVYYGYPYYSYSPYNALVPWFWTGSGPGTIVYCRLWV